MSAWFGWLAAAVSTVACLAFWFRDVKKIMEERQSTVESAARQFAVCSRRAKEAQGRFDTLEILDRSENIYRQAVDAYNRTRSKLWVRLPAALMGFDFIG